MQYSPCNTPAFALKSPMSTLSGISDVDRQIISYLNPPQILTVSEVDTYMCKLVAELRAQFTQAKFDIGESIKHNYEYVVQWHIDNLTQSINSFKRRHLDTEAMRKDLCYQYLNTCFLHNNYPFTLFLIEHRPTDRIEGNICGAFDNIFAEPFDINFVKYVDKCLYDIHNLTLQKIGIDCKYETYHRHLIELFRTKQYADAEYLINLNKRQNTCIHDDLFNLSDKGCFSMKEIRSESFISLCDKLNISKERYHNHILHRSCLKKTDKHFFELIKQIPKFDCGCIIWSACRGGHVSIGQWLLDEAQLRNQDVDLDEYEFIYISNKGLSCNPIHIASLRGKLEMLQWLLKINPKFDIHAKNEQCIRMACIEGHISIVQYLFEISEQTNYEIDIHVNSDRLLRSAIHRLHLELAEWLICKGFEYNSPFDLCKIRTHAIKQRWGAKRSFWKKIYKWIKRMLEKYYDMSTITLEKFGYDDIASDSYDEVYMITEETESSATTSSKSCSDDSSDEYFGKNSLKYQPLVKKSPCQQIDWNECGDWGGDDQ